MQDIVHITAKLRNRLLNSLIVLLIGNKIASISHLKMLINLLPKDTHGLVYSDICPDDRQNYESVKKIMHPNVRTALAQHVIDSEATIEYLQICSEISSSLYDEGLSPLERVFRLWRSTFFLRACRFHIIKTDNLTLENNFITWNAYSCIENNAQNLIIIIRKFRDNGLTEMFLPTLFNSQPCEENFRKMRSMGSMNYTRINFTMLELIHLVGRVELMNDIMFFKLADSDVYFPRNPTTRKSKIKFELPTDDEIRTTVSTALNTAVLDATKFGMSVTSEEIEDCKLKKFTINLEVEHEDISSEHIDLGIGSKKNKLECENLRDYSNKNSESNSYVNVTGQMGSKTVRKTGLIWNLTSSKKKIKC